MNKPHRVTEIQSKPYPRLCAECGEQGVTATTIAYDADVKHDGKLHKFRVTSLRIDKCQACGEEYFTNETDDQISAGLRDTLGLLQPEVIRGRLSELKVLQREFAEHLRVAPESVSRWITGSVIQTRAIDTLMRLYFAFPEVRSALISGRPLSGLGVGDVVTVDRAAKAS